MSETMEARPTGERYMLGAVWNVSWSQVNEIWEKNRWMIVLINREEEWCSSMTEWWIRMRSISRKESTWCESGWRWVTSWRHFFSSSQEWMGFFSYRFTWITRYSFEMCVIERVNCKWYDWSIIFWWISHSHLRWGAGGGECEHKGKREMKECTFKASNLSSSLYVFKKEESS